MIRNGSGIYQIGETHMNHVADGLSVLHKFEIARGKVTYRNRILKSDTYTKCQQANRLVIHQFGTAILNNLPAVIVSICLFINTCSIQAQLQ